MAWKLSLELQVSPNLYFFMPSRSQHLRASRLVFGNAIPVVHDILDRYLPDIEHRRTHDPTVIKKIAELLGERAKEEAWLHFMLDYKLADYRKLVELLG